VSVNVRVLAATNGDLEADVRPASSATTSITESAQVSLACLLCVSAAATSWRWPSTSCANRARVLHLGEDACRALLAHSWPGNIRELRNLVTKAAVFASGPTAWPRETSAYLRCDPPGASFPAAAQTVNLEALERRASSRRSTTPPGHQGRAADLLGISVRTLSRKLAQYGQGRVPAYAGSGHDPATPVRDMTRPMPGRDMVMSWPEVDRRHGRRAAVLEDVTLLLDTEPPVKLPGVLVDISREGFRVRHPCSHLACGSELTIRCSAGKAARA